MNRLASVFCRVVTIQGLLAFGACLCSYAVDEPMAVLFLRPQNATSNEDSAHWHFSLPMFFEYKAEGPQPFRFLPEISVDSAFHELGFSQEQEITAVQLLQVGRLLEARRVIWSSYSREGGTWNLKFRIINVASGATSPPDVVSAPEWKEIIERAFSMISEALTGADGHKADLQASAPFSTSPKAIELISRAYAEMAQKKPLASTTREIREALDDDPRFSLALRALVYCLRSESELNEALQIAERAVKQFPNSAGCHAALGSVYVAKKMQSFAREEYEEAIRLDPNTPKYLLALAEVHLNRGDFDRCSAALEQASKMMPLVAGVHAFLGQVRACQRRREDALRELRLAERYDTGDDWGTTQQLAQGYDTANEPSKAILYYEKFLAQAKQLGIGQQFIEEGSAALAAQKVRLKEGTVVAKEPRSYSQVEFDTAVKKRLASDEAGCVRNPFTTTADMKEFAKSTISGSDSDEEKARKLFLLLARSTDSKEGGTCRTSEEAFAHWRSSNISLNCQDFTLLYVALARSIGLNVYFAGVTRDYEGSLVSHACAAAFIGTNTVLIDPMYRWYGVPHQKFALRDDVEVTGLLLAESGDKRQEDVGLKLLGEWAGPRFIVAFARLRRGSVGDGREVLLEALKLDQESYLANYGMAVIQTYEKRWDQAEVYLRKCLSATPNWNQARFLLGEVLSKQNKLAEARRQWRLYLEGNTDPKLADDARAAIALINESIPD